MGEKMRKSRGVVNPLVAGEVVTAERLNGWMHANLETLMHARMPHPAAEKKGQMTAGAAVAGAAVVAGLCGVPMSRRRLLRFWAK